MLNDYDEHHDNGEFPKYQPMSYETSDFEVKEKWELNETLAYFGKNSSGVYKLEGKPLFNSWQEFEAIYDSDQKINEQKTIIYLVLSQKNM